MSVVYDNEAGRFVNTDDAKLRDLFAMAALGRMIAYYGPSPERFTQANDGAKAAYAWADAMMEARK